MKVLNYIGVYTGFITVERHDNCITVMCLPHYYDDGSRSMHLNESYICMCKMLGQFLEFGNSEKISYVEVDLEHLINPDVWIEEDDVGKQTFSFTIRNAEVEALRVELQEIFTKRFAAETI